MKNQTTLTRILLVLSLAIIFILPMWLPATLEAQTDKRGIELTPVNKLPEKGKRFALVIGVDEYQNQQIKRLVGAANDARLLAKALIENAGFASDNVKVIATGEPPSRQPTRGNILRWLSRLRMDMPKDGLLLFSFSGHGIDRNQQAYLLPTDAQYGDDFDLLENTSLNVQTISDTIRKSGIKQVMMILDACRSNPEGRDIGVTDKTANKLTESYTRGFNFEVRNQEIKAFVKLYSTSVGQLAYEDEDKNQGYFTYALVEGLKGAAANANGEVTLAGLVKYVEEQVPKRITSDLGREKHQKPWAEMQGYKANELVISITARVTIDKPLAATVDPATIELEFWNSMKNSADVEDFQEYLRQYPNGRFAGLARNKIRQFSPKTKKQEDVKVQTYTETVNRVGIEMVRVPAGKFIMGSPAGEKGRNSDEGPQHEVTVSSFYMGKYEVTQLQWRAVSVLPKVKIDLPSDPAEFKGDNLPVEQVSWNEAVEFCERLSKATGKTFRLPTEAEWEYACRAGTTGMYAGNVDSMAWYHENSGSTTHPVGQKQANRFGLYDMHGNVWEWCQDRYDENYYYQGPSTNPTGPSSGLYRVSRGGSWLPLGDLRSANRWWYGNTPDKDHSSLGFRLVRNYN